MKGPVRLQLSRRKGFNLQALSTATNGLPAVNCARPGKWGNPIAVGPAIVSQGVNIPEITAASAVQIYREWMECAYQRWPSTREAVATLRGKNLACWCKPGAPCHTDVLLEMANR